MTISKGTHASVSQNSPLSSHSLSRKGFKRISNYSKIIWISL